MDVRARLAAPMMTLLLLCLLTGCGEQTTTRESKALEQYAALTSFSGTAQVTADYGTKVYQYEVQTSGDLTDGRLEVISPENIAGITFCWSEGGGTAQFEDVSLETGSLSPDGLSPVDAMSLFLTTLTTGKLNDSCLEVMGEEEALRLTLANPSYPEGKSEVTLWLSAEDFSLRRGEVAWEGQTVITYQFTDFSFTTEQVS